MVLPVTGPTNKSVTQRGPATSLGFKPVWYQSNSTTYKQAKPYNLVLSYSRTIDQVLAFSASDPSSYEQVGGIVIDSTLVADARNQAYERLQGSLSASASLGAGLAESRQSMDMIVKRASQIGRIVKHVKRGQISKALDELRVPENARTSKAKAAKNLADFWLETTFGWVPLFSDIHSAIDVTQNPLPSTKIRGSAAVSKDVATYTRTTSAYGGFVSQRNDVHYKCKCVMGARVVLVNKNLYLANQLGLLNPLSVAWEVVPWSFAVDWLGNVGNYLRSFTDFVGCNITGSFTSTKSSTVASGSARAAYCNLVPGKPGQVACTYTYLDSSKQRVEFVRGSGLTSPTLRFSLPDRVSPKRALTAVSLLLQQVLK